LDQNWYNAKIDGKFGKGEHSPLSEVTLFDVTCCPCVVIADGRLT